MTEALDFEITKDILSKVTKQAIVGVPQDSIGMILGFTKDEFVVILTQSPELYNAIQKGYSIGLSRMRQALYRKAVRGDVRAAELLNNLNPLTDSDSSSLLPDGATGIQINWTSATQGNNE